MTFTFALTACSNNSDEVKSSSIKTDVNTSNILTFKSKVEFDSIVNSVNSMKPEERMEWEKLKGFKSFGTICDEFYATITPQNFNSIEDVNAFVSANSDKIQIYKNDAGDSYCEVREFDNASRYLMNKDRMYIIGSTIIKKFDEGVISTDIANINLIKNTKSYYDLKTNSAVKANLITKQKSAASNTIVQSTELYNEHSVNDGWFGAKQTYRLVVRLKAENTTEASSTYDHHFIQVSNYVWHVVLFNVSRTTNYNISMYVTDITFGNLLFHPVKTNANFSEDTPVNDSPFIAGGNVNS